MTESRNTPRLEYALEALRLFSAAGRWVPADRLVWFGDEQGPVRAVHRSARQVVYLLRLNGYRIEARSQGHSAYRMPGGTERACPCC